MGFNLSDRYITALNFLLVGAIVYCLALVVSGAIKLHYAEGSGLGSAQIARQAFPARSARPRTRADYDTIVRRNVFDLAPPKPTPPPVTHDETINVTLLGTSRFGRGGYAIIQTPDGDQQLYRLGDVIPHVGRLLAVGPDRAIVLHNGHRVAITIPSGYDGQQENIRPFRGPIRRPLMNNPMMRRRRMMGANDGVRELAANHYLLRRAVVDSNLQNMSRLFTEIRAIPRMQNGSSSGYQLSEIQPGSIFQQIGLRDGDILTSAQGQSVGDPLKAMQLLQTLRNQSSITLSVIRNGSPLQIHYSIQ